MTQAWEDETIEAFSRDALAQGSAADVVLRYGEALVTTTGADLAYDLGALWRYDRDAGVWRELDRATVTRLVQGVDGIDVVELEGKVKRLKVSGALWRDVYDGLSCRPRERAGFFDEAPAGLAFADGFLRLNGDAKLEAHAPEHRARHAYPMRWDPEARCDWWERVLVQWGLDDEQRRFLAQWAGVALAGEMTANAKVLLLLGPGENGKSICTKVIEGLFPAEWRQSINLQALGDRFTGAMLRDCRLNSVADASTKDFLDTGPFKAVVSGDSIKVEAKYKDGYQLRPRAAHMISINPPLPAVPDVSAGFWRRFEALEFLVSFKDRADKILDLDRKLLESEKPGIVAWAVRGYLDHRRNGWQAVGRDALSDWRHGQDTIGLWLEDRVDVQATGRWTRATDCYEDFARWCKANGKGAWSSTRFGTDLKVRLGVARHRRASQGVEYELSLVPLLVSVRSTWSA